MKQETPPSDGRNPSRKGEEEVNNYLPVQILTGRLGYAWLLAPPAAAAVCLALAVLIFRAGMRSYESAGH